MTSNSQKKVLDLLLCGLVLYASFWVYELSNYAAYAMVGSRAGLLINGFLPSAVGSVVGAQSLLVKPIQTLLSCSVLGSLYFLARKSGASLSEWATLSSLSIFVASFYWEFFTFLSFISYDVHLMIFTGIAVGVELFLLRSFPLFPVSHAVDHLTRTR